MKDYNCIIMSNLENPTEEKVDSAYRHSRSIVRIGDVYKKFFLKRINEFRQLDGNEDFAVHMVDWKGDEFYFS